jgi:hypothetical protein
VSRSGRYRRSKTIWSNRAGSFLVEAEAGGEYAVSLNIMWVIRLWFWSEVSRVDLVLLRRGSSCEALDEAWEIMFPFGFLRNARPP